MYILVYNCVVFIYKSELQKFNSSLNFALNRKNAMHKYKKVIALIILFLLFYFMI